MAYTIGVYFFFFFNGSEGWEVQDQGVSQFGFQVRALFLAGKLCLSIYPHTAETERGSKLSGVSSCKRENPTMRAPPLRLELNLIISPKPHPQISSHWRGVLGGWECGREGDSASEYEWGDDTTQCVTIRNSRNCRVFQSYGHTLHSLPQKAIS